MLFVETTKLIGGFLQQLRFFIAVKADIGENDTIFAYFFVLLHIEKYKYHHNLFFIMNTNYVFFANGFEEIEALTVVDILRRAGMPVATVSINEGNEVEGAHGVTIVADTLMSEINPSEAGWLILPGGMPGATNLRENEELCDMLRNHAREGRMIAAICASPSVVLASLGLLDGVNATCYPGMALESCDAMWSADMVVADANFVTGKGPAAATAFALAIVSAAMGEDVAHNVAQGLLAE